MNLRLRRWAPCTVLSLLVALGGCTAGPDDPLSGPITFVHSVDTTSGQQVEKLVAEWNAEHGDEQVTFQPLPAETDRQRQWLLEASTSPRFDVLALDVIWVAEFARAGLLRELAAGELPPAEQFLPGPWRTTQVDGKSWAVPFNTNAALLYYRTDLLDEIGVSGPPGDDLAALAQRVRARDPAVGGYAGQYDRYEGLVVNVFEAVWAAGGEVLSDSGTEVRIGQPNSRAGLRAFVQTVRSGLVPPQARDFREEQGVAAFGAGNLLFLRSWPYAYARLRATAVNGKFAVRPLRHQSVLGGIDLAISARSRHPNTAADFIEFMTRESSQRRLRDLGSLPPSRTALYSSNDATSPDYMPELSEALNRARPRPVTEHYAAISHAIADVVYAALFPANPPPEGRAPDVDSVVDQIVRDVEARLATILTR